MAGFPGRTRFETVRASFVNIGDLFELFCDKGGAVRDKDPTGRQFANQCAAVRIDERHAG
jgi:hypothetical protein